jgi:hypothetical protein
MKESEPGAGRTLMLLVVSYSFRFCGDFGFELAWHAMQLITSGFWGNIASILFANKCISRD